MKRAFLLIIFIFTTSSAFANYLDTEISFGVKKYDNGNIATSVAKAADIYMPYGKLRLFFLDGADYIPQITIESSGDFSFDSETIEKTKKDNSMALYSVYLPLGVPVPFFTYKSKIILGFDYFRATSRYTVKNEFTLKDISYTRGDDIMATSNGMTFKLGLTTPAAKESFFSNSSFGVFYKEYSMPRSTEVGKSVASPELTIVNSKAQYGGIYYTLHTDTPLKNFNVDISVMLGIGEIKARDTTNMNEKLDTLRELLGIDINVALSYRYPFTEYFAAAASFGGDYSGLSQLLNAPNPKKYTLSLGGTLSFFGSLNFIFSF